MSDNDNPDSPQKEASNGVTISKRTLRYVAAAFAVVLLAGSAYLIGRETSSHLQSERAALGARHSSRGRRTLPAASTTTTTSPPTTTTALPSTTTTTSPPTTTTPISSVFTPGTYTDGSPGSAYYFLLINNSSNGDLAGSLNFLYQDGQTSVVFTFVGTVNGSVATLDPTSIPQNNGSASQSPGSVPSVISATATANTILLGECNGFMHFAGPASACIFNFSPGGYNS